MATTGTPERTGASGPYYAIPPAPPRRMFGTAGYVGLGVVGLFTTFLIMKAISSFSEGAMSPPVQETYEEVDLGQVSRELAPEAGGLLREPFMLKVVLVLNPKTRDLAGAKAQVERRRNLFRDIILSELIAARSDADLRKPATLEALKGEIRQRLNQELSGSKGDSDVILKVLFPERRLPERR
jgi:flagellar basal body-associated protein FliL